MNATRTSTLDDAPLPVRTKLAAAWASFMFFYIYVDHLHLYKPGIVDDILAGIVWATLKRENPVLKYEHVNFRISDLEVEDEEADEAEAEDKGKESEAVS
jgi:hypothetical protein